MAAKGDHTTLINISRGLPILSVSSKAITRTPTGTILTKKKDMKKLKRLQYGDFLIKGKNLMEVMIENKLYRRYINHLGRLSKNALPF